MLYNTTLSALIERMCRTILNDWKSGTATGGSTTTIVDAVRRDEPDDYFQNTSPISYAYILTTTDNLAPKSEERRASDFANSGGTLSVVPAYSVTPGAGDTYAIYHLKRWADLKEYINMAIDMVKAETLLPKIDETYLTLQGSVFEYPVPEGMTHLFRVTQSDAELLFYNSDPIDPTLYRIVKNLGNPILRFESSAGLTDGYKLRIEGFGTQEKLVNDTDICYLNPDFVVAQAGAFIHASLARRADNEPDAHQTQYQIWQAVASDVRASQGFKTALPPNCKRLR
jgi:hypothetical protein